MPSALSVDEDGMAPGRNCTVGMRALQVVPGVLLSLAPWSRIDAD